MKIKSFAITCILVCFSLLSFSQTERNYVGKLFNYSFIIDTAIWQEANETKLKNKMIQDTELAGKPMIYEYLFATDDLPQATIPFFTLMVLPTQGNVYSSFKTEFNKEFFDKIVESNEDLFKKHATVVEFGGLSFDDKKQSLTAFIPIKRGDGADLLNMMHVVCHDNKFAQFTFASTKKDFAILYPYYLNIVNSFTWNETKELSFSLKNTASFIIPKSLEIQAGFMKELAKKKYTEKGIEYQVDEIVLQQKGLNSFKKEAFNTFFRIILKPIHERVGLYSVDFNLADIETTNAVYMQRVKETLSTSMTFLREFPPKTIKINGIPCFVFSYERQLGNKPPVTVNHYIIQKGKDLISLMISNRTEEKSQWNNTITEFLKSLKFK